MLKRRSEKFSSESPLLQEFRLLEGVYLRTILGTANSGRP